ncbi:MAG: cation:proton antiporter [Gammaproteobacteria bacterium]|nr:cation:proton antiporter [Gammaproteobacteria bacterium]
MELGHFLLLFAVILVSARALGELAQFFSIPPVLGELLAGVLLGPSLLNLVQPNEIWNILSEIGVILLLFEVGLESDFNRLTRTGNKPYLVASVGFFTPLILAYFLTHFIFHLSTLTSLFIAGTLTATSIGITVRVLSDLKQRHSHEAQIVIGAAVLDDVLGVLLLALLYDFAVNKTVSLGATAQTGAYILFFLLITPLLAKALFNVLDVLDLKKDSPGLLLTLTFSLILFCSALAEFIGAPLILGGFAAGIAASKQFGPKIRYSSLLNTLFKPNAPLSNRIEHQTKPLIHLYTPIFFVIVGASLNLHEVPWHSSFIWLLTLSVFAVAIIGKLIAGFAIKEPRKQQILIGTSMIPRGEVGLIFAKMGLLSAALNSVEYAALILVVTLTTFLPPFALRWLYARGNHQASNSDKTRPNQGV